MIGADTHPYSSCRVIYPSCFYGPLELQPDEWIRMEVLIRSNRSPYAYVVTRHSKIRGHDKNNDNASCEYFGPLCRRGELTLGHSNNSKPADKCDNRLMGAVVPWTGGGIDSSFFIDDYPGPSSLPDEPYNFGER